ncbi:MAG: diacylglycerol kinase [Parcubacteria group bacterium GW2011_GWC2_49_9]|nr:MAG: diacylglycerol kinase [Parcubacteria group bacterium GW2011_GWA2_48_9]KKW14389.1 MAG: diacylglycerol kinase [Parcubacteria group bacterium GW2011_GWC2_49_9]
MTFFTSGRFRRSFQYAFRGLAYVARQEQSFRLHIIATVLVIALMLYLGVNLREAVILFMVITSVLVLELINTIFESLVDMLQPRIHHLAQVIKDIMAAAVFIASVGALIIGLLIFIPYLVERF